MAANGPSRRLPSVYDIRYQDVANISIYSTDCYEKLARDSREAAAAADLDFAGMAAAVDRIKTLQKDGKACEKLVKETNRALRKQLGKYGAVSREPGGGLQEELDGLEPEAVSKLTRLYAGLFGNLDTLRGNAALLRDAEVATLEEKIRELRRAGPGASGDGAAAARREVGLQEELAAAHGAAASAGERADAAERAKQEQAEQAALRQRRLEQQAIEARHREAEATDRAKAEQHRAEAAEAESARLEAANAELRARLAELSKRDEEAVRAHVDARVEGLKAKEARLQAEAAGVAKPEVERTREREQRAGEAADAADAVAALEARIREMEAERARTAEDNERQWADAQDEARRELDLSKQLAGQREAQYSTLERQLREAQALVAKQGVQSAELAESLGRRVSAASSRARALEAALKSAKVSHGAKASSLRLSLKSSRRQKAAADMNTRDLVAELRGLRDKYDLLDTAEDAGRDGFADAAARADHLAQGLLACAAGSDVAAGWGELVLAARVVHTAAAPSPVWTVRRPWLHDDDDRREADHQSTDALLLAIYASAAAGLRAADVGLVGQLTAKLAAADAVDASTLVGTLTRFADAVDTGPALGQLAAVAVLHLLDVLCRRWDDAELTSRLRAAGERLEASLAGSYLAPLLAWMRQDVVEERLRASPDAPELRPGLFALTDPSWEVFVLADRDERSLLAVSKQRDRTAIKPGNTVLFSDPAGGSVLLPFGESKWKWWWDATFGGGRRFGGKT